MRLSQVSLLILLLSFNACSNKSITKKTCGENTILESAGIGAIAGTVLAKVANASGIIGAVIGASIGGIMGNQLSSMQCKYHGETQKLLNKINKNIQEQNQLFKETNAFNKRMYSLYNEIHTFTQYSNFNKEEQANLYLEISKKRNNLENLNLLTRNIRQNSQYFLKELEKKNFSTKDTQSIQESLKRIFINLTKIEASSTYNLSQLEKFEMKWS